MSSRFDNEVANERRKLPGAAVNLARLMHHLLWSGGHDHDGPQPVTLTLEYRRDVDTSHWWRLRWGGDGADGCVAEAKDLELCLFRAAVMARRDEGRAETPSGSR
jgi:hypothetical protein